MRALLLVSGLLFSCSSLAVEPLNFQSLAAECAPGVHLKTLSSIVRHESAANPYAIGLNAPGQKLPRPPASKEEAVATGKWLKAHGYNFDGGFGQVNVKNMDWLGLTMDDLFDPCKNLTAAAKVITDCYQRASRKFADNQVALHAALSCYNTGNFEDGITNGYVKWVAQYATLDVPALMPVSTGKLPPVQLKATKEAVSIDASVPAATKAPHKKEGIGDAFSRQSSGAFSVKPEPAQDEAAVGAGQDPQAPMVPITQ
ncbi:lytic transglycosylase domain-containing protein [Pseudomonas protegens]|uniref:lytic transglycosylase domain-containing protein n=1 Tax=Pseudomonas protegens TaxID=380021 RepID=UPI0023EAE7A6|nr:lytic transglycosylase domain-containing protein [Pseudomonas protegens]MDF4211144.1 lytic transglycosylase domain-containing protein [Pseudomonas protegens]